MSNVVSLFEDARQLAEERRAQESAAKKYAEAEQTRLSTNLWQMREMLQKALLDVHGKLVAGGSFHVNWVDSRRVMLTIEPGNTHQRQMWVGWFVLDVVMVKDSGRDPEDPRAGQERNVPRLWGRVYPPGTPAASPWPHDTSHHNLSCESPGGMPSFFQDLAKELSRYL